MAIIPMRRSLNSPTSTPQGNSTLRAYDQQGNPVYVERGQYYPGVSMTAPQNNINPQTTQGTQGLLPQGQTQTNPQADAYNNLMMDLMKKAQGVDTIELLKRRRELQRAQLGASSEALPAGTALSPSQQQSIISSKQGTYSADLDENAYQLAKAEKAISNFEDIYQKSVEFGEEWEKNAVIPESMIQQYKTIIENDPDRMTTLLASLNDKSKQAVISALDYGNINNQSTSSTRTSSQTSTKFNKTLNKEKLTKYFDDNFGKNELVSPDDYLVAKQAWVSDGGKEEDFETYFYKRLYTNPALNR